MNFIGTLKNKCSARNVVVLTLGFMVLTLFVMCFSKGIQGNDFWWHVKVGEWICENLKVPTQDIFSWYGIEHSLDWTAHEWLSDVMYYLILQFTGEVGIYLFSVGAALLMFALIWNEVKEYALKNLIFSSVFFLAFPFVLHTFFYGRPHLFSFFFLFFELKCLYKFIENPKSRAIYFIPLISCLWSNFHGGSSNLSYLLCVVFLVAGLLPENIGRLSSVRFNKKDFFKLFGVTVASVLGILVNPIGLEVLMYPYVSMGDSLMLSVITEWRAPDAKEFGELILYFLPIFVLTIGFFTEKTKIRAIDVLVFLVFLFLFFRSVRFIMLWYIAAAFYAFRYMPKFELKRIKNSYKVIVSIFVALLLINPFVNSFAKAYSTYTENSLITEILNDEMIEFVKEDAPARLYNDYNYGEALIYNDIKVFYDARADLYAADNILANGVSLMNLKQMNSAAESSHVNVDALIRQYDFDAILISKTRPLYSYLLSHSNDFECLYEDDVSAYFRVVNIEK